ncbi:asparagine synthase C-terminal domain-containing protein [Candidatus Bathyarchaeota archaeon]|nr:asparagine synthase C-terminal domain-containing protein [Candidatus Bathyarchaeota archaeon]
MIRQLENEIVRNIRTIPREPLSLLLSGGIDSSLVLALIRREYPEIPIHTFSLARNDGYPDITYAHKIAELFGTDHHEKILSCSELEGYSREYDGVRQHSFRGDINVYILCSIAREYSNVVVTGDGGDECFGGYWLHKFPLGHKETGQITRFEDIHPDSQKHLKEMVRLGFKDFLYKARSTEEDYEAVWEYFVEVLLPNHMEPLLHTAQVLNLDVYTPLFSKNLIDFLRTIPIKQRINRKIERALASKYLPKSIIERKSMGFDVALEKELIYK